MCVSNLVRLRRQVRFLKRQFLQDDELPFTDVLSVEAISEALTAAEIVWKERIYPPLVTLWVFLSQVLSADHSRRRSCSFDCTSALAR